jgi:hypothetical protein
MAAETEHPTFRQALDSVTGRTLRSNLGRSLDIQLRPPIAERDVAALLDAAGVTITGTWREMLTTTNGISLFGVDVLGLGPATDPRSVLSYRAMLQYNLVPFHDWGNGDLDCLDMTKTMDDEPAVVFWDDKRDTTVMICSGFAKWIGMAVEDLERYGKLLHPDDYRTPEFTGATGVYESPANIRQAFLGDFVPPRPAAPPSPAPTGRRDKLKRLFKGMIGR